MKTKSFDALLKTRFSDEEIAEIKRQAQLEVDMLRAIQKILSGTITEYMQKNKIGLNEVARYLFISSSQAAKIQRGEANLTLAKFAYFLTLMGKEAKDIFKME
jgi:hypothetical protein